MSSSSVENSSQLQRRKNEFDKTKAISKHHYIREYEKFMEWKMYSNEEHLNENVLLRYFKELSERLKAEGKPNYLNTVYCQLENVIAKEHDLAIESYEQLKAFLKEMKNDPQFLLYSKKPVKTFTSKNIEKFLKYAPDDHYLVIKVALIFGVNGACKSRELSAITVCDIQQVSDNLIMVNVRGNDNNDGDRSFIVCGEHLHIVNKYLTMRRSLDIPTNKLFILFRKGKFIKRAMRKHNFNQMARKIATFINLPNPELYSENCFRKTSEKLISVVGDGFANKTERVSISCKSKTKKSEQKSIKNEETLKELKLKSKQAQAPVNTSVSATEDPKPVICINISDKSINVQSSSYLNLVADSSNAKCFTWDESKDRDPLAANDSCNNSDISDSDDESSDDDSATKQNKETTVKHVFKDCENVSDLFISL